MRSTVAALAVVLLLAACAPAPSPTPVPSISLGLPTLPPVSPGLPTSPVDGVVIDVDSRGLNDVRGFTIRTSDGTELTFTLDRLENGSEFPPSHLTEHAVGAVPVRVTFVADGDILAATRLDDAG